MTWRRDLLYQSNFSNELNSEMTKLIIQRNILWFDNSLEGFDIGFNLQYSNLCFSSRTDKRQNLKCHKHNIRHCSFQINEHSFAGFYWISLKLALNKEGNKESRIYWCLKPLYFRISKRLLPMLSLDERKLWFSFSNKMAMD